MTHRIKSRGPAFTDGRRPQTPLDGNARVSLRTRSTRA